MFQAQIEAIEYALPEGTLSNAEISAKFPDWKIEKIRSKTGIENRRIAGPDEFSSDLAIAAGQRLFEARPEAKEAIDFVLLCTQSPDYFLPTTACLVQNRLGLSKSVGALDFNLGCSGYVYGLGLAKGLIESGQAKNVLLITAETYSKFLHPQDRGTRTIFGDAAAATWVKGVDGAGEGPAIGPLVYGSDGSGADNLIVRNGIRNPREVDAETPGRDAGGNLKSNNHLYMNGPELFSFTIREIPKLVDETLARAKLSLDNVDLFVFHQANRYMLEHLRSQLEIPESKFFLALSHCGNTVSSTIPIALKEASTAGAVKRGDRVLLVGFGVGYSWGAAVIRWA